MALAGVCSPATGLSQDRPLSEANISCLVSQQRKWQGSMSRREEYSRTQHLRTNGAEGVLPSIQQACGISPPAEAMLSEEEVLCLTRNPRLTLADFALMDSSVDRGRRALAGEIGGSSLYTEATVKESLASELRYYPKLLELPWRRPIHDSEIWASCGLSAVHMRLLSPFMADIVPVVGYLDVPTIDEEMWRVWGTSSRDWGTTARDSRLDYDRIRELRNVVQVVAIECRVAGHITEQDEVWINMQLRETSYVRDLALRLLLREHDARIEAVGGPRTKAGAALEEEARRSEEAFSVEAVAQEGLYLAAIYDFIIRNCGSEDITDFPEPQRPPSVSLLPPEPDGGSRRGYRR